VAELFQQILFYAFAAVLVGAALGVITARNPVHAVLLLVLAFFTSAAIWLLLEAEFLALTLVLSTSPPCGRASPATCPSGWWWRR